MKKNRKPAGKQTGNKVQEILNKAAALSSKLKKLLIPALVNFDYKDEEGTVVFSTESEEDTLAVGDAVTLADGGTEGTFTLDDGRIVAVVDNVVTEISEEDETSEEIEELNNRIEELENALRESDSYENTGAKYNNPHRALYTTKVILGVGVDNESSAGDIEIWYDRDSRKVKMEGMGVADAKLINPDLFALAI